MPLILSFGIFLLCAYRLRGAVEIYRAGRDVAIIRHWVPPKSMPFLSVSFIALKLISIPFCYSWNFFSPDAHRAPKYFVGIILPMPAIILWSIKTVFIPRPRSFSGGGLYNFLKFMEVKFLSSGSGPILFKCLLSCAVFVSSKVILPNLRKSEKTK